MRSRFLGAHRSRHSVGLSGLALSIGLATIACGTQRSLAPLPYAGDLEHGVGDFGSLLYVRQLAPIEQTALLNDEFGAVTVDNDRGRLYSAGRSGELIALDRVTGRVHWERDLASAISVSPLLADNGHLLVGTDDGALVAIEADSGEVAWRYETVGTIRNSPIVHDGVVYFVNSRDQIFALDVRSGGWRWQYERDLPTGFSIRGRAGLTFVPGPIAARHNLQDDIGVLFTGFADGRVAALSASSGEALWLTDLAPPGVSEFVDVDTTPLVDTERGEIIVAGQEVGVRGLAIDDGTARWSLDLRGAGSISRLGADAYVVASSLEGLLAFESGGRVRWRRQVGVGVLGKPIADRDRCFVPHSEDGLLVYSAARGELLGAVDVGSGISGGVTIDGEHGQLFVTTNRGALLAFQLPAE